VIPNDTDPGLEFGQASHHLSHKALKAAQRVRAHWFALRKPAGGRGKRVQRVEHRVKT
jgi:hypothetical protein